MGVYYFIDFQAAVGEREMGANVLWSLYTSLFPPSTLYLIPFLSSCLSKPLR